MQRILIKKNEFIFSFWEEQSASWIDRNINEKDLPISWYLPYSVEIERDVTLRDFLTTLSKHGNAVELIFANYLSGVTISELIKQIQLDNFTKRDMEINTLYLFKMAEIAEVDGTDYPLIDIYPALVGLKADEDITQEGIYYLSSIDVRHWADYPFELDGFIEFTNTKDDEIELNGLVNWSLFEVISTILFQVSISIQVSQASQVNSENRIAAGPMLIEELFVWMDELDRIFLLQQ